MGKKQLVVHLDRSAVKFQRVIGEDVELDFHFEFTDKTDFGYKDQLDAFLTKTDFRTMEWDEYSLSWFSEKTTLLPFSVFAQVDTVKAFQLSFGTKIDQNEIDFNRIPENTLVNLFEIPAWVKSFFITRFPRMVIQHVGTHLIRGLFETGAFSLKILLIPIQEHFLLLGVKDNELMFYNSFDFQSKEDLFYHTAHCVHKQNWSGLKGKLIVCEPMTELNLFEELKQDWSKIDLFKNLTLLHDPQLLTKFQLLCV